MIFFRVILSTVLNELYGKSSVVVSSRVGGFRIITVLCDNIQVWLFPIPLCKVLHGTFSIEHQVDNDKLAAHRNYQKIV